MRFDMHLGTFNQILVLIAGSLSAVLITYGIDIPDAACSITL